MTAHSPVPPGRRRGVRRTVLVLVLLAVAVYVGFLASGGFGA